MPLLLSRSRRHCLDRYTPEQNTAQGDVPGFGLSPHPGQRRSCTGPSTPATNPGWTHQKIQMGGSEAGTKLEQCVRPGDQTVVEIDSEPG
jgi:hypothetical protein